MSVHAVAPFNPPQIAGGGSNGASASCSGGGRTESGRPLWAPSLADCGNGYAESGKHEDGLEACSMHEVVSARRRQNMKELECTCIQTACAAAAVERVAAAASSSSQTVWRSGAGLPAAGAVRTGLGTT